MRPPRDKGFTLLEVMFAVAVLAIAFTAIFRLQSQSVFMAGQMRFETTAPLLAQMKMSEIMAKDDDEVTTDSGDFGDTWPRYSWRAEVFPVESEVLDVTADRVKKIELSVTYDKGVFTYTLTAFRLMAE